MHQAKQFIFPSLFSSIFITASAVFV